MKFWSVVIEKLPANAMALFPFVLVRKASYKDDQVLINHEKIHLKQQLELLIIPFYILYFFNYLINLILYRNHYLAYFNISFEREAYHYESDLTYLTKRKFYKWTSFL